MKEKISSELRFGLSKSGRTEPGMIISACVIVSEQRPALGQNRLAGASSTNVAAIDLAQALLYRRREETQEEPPAP